MWETSPSWRARIWLGLISSTFSTVVGQLAAGRIGRDALVDWMLVASIPLRDSILEPEPNGAGSSAMTGVPHATASIKTRQMVLANRCERAGRKRLREGRLYGRRSARQAV